MTTRTRHENQLKTSQPGRFERISRILVRGGVSYAAALFLFGCDDQTLGHLLESAPTDQALSCSGDEVKTWDLGDGTPEQVRAKAPEFWRLKPQDYEQKAPANSLEASKNEDERRYGFRSENHDRVKLLEDMLRTANPDHIVLSTFRRGEFDLLRFQVDGDQAVKPAVISWISKDEPSAIRVLTTAPACHHFVAKQVCLAKRRHIEVRVASSTCSAEETPLVLTFATSAHNQETRPLVPGVVAQIQPKQSQAFNPRNLPRAEVVRDGSSDVLWEGTLGDGTIAGARQPELLAVLDIPDSEMATKIYDALPKTPSLERAVIEKRTTVAARLLAALQDESALGRVLSLGIPPTKLPGDVEVGRSIGSRLQVADDALAQTGSAPKTAMLREQLLGAAIMWDQSRNTTLQPRRQALQEQLGKALVAETIDDPSVITWFKITFPQSPYLDLYNRKVSERQQATALASRVEDAWTDVAKRIDEIATLMSKRQTALPFIRTDLQKVGIKMMAADIARKTREDFCEAKQAYVALVGAAEFQKHANKKCSSDAPETNGLNGTQLTLTAECRSIIATPCATVPKPR